MANLRCRHRCAAPVQKLRNRQPEPPDNESPMTDRLGERICTSDPLVPNKNRCAQLIRLGWRCFWQDPSTWFSAAIGPRFLSRRSPASRIADHCRALGLLVMPVVDAEHSKVLSLHSRNWAVLSLRLSTLQLCTTRVREHERQSIEPFLPNTCLRSCVHPRQSPGVALADGRQLLGAIHCFEFRDRQHDSLIGRRGRDRKSPGKPKRRLTGWLTDKHEVRLG